MGIQASTDERTARLITAVQDLSHARTNQEVRDIVRHAARRLLDADGATFVLKDGGNCYYVDEDAISPLWKGLRFPLENCISGWAMNHRESVVIPDIYLDDRIPIDAYRVTFVKSLVMVPIRQASPIGAVGIYWDHEYEATPQEVALAQALADTTAVALENVELIENLEAKVTERTLALNEANRKLSELSLTDELTGLNNRRGFFAFASHQLSMSRLEGLNSQVVFFDLDGLKTINDSLGHEAGDEAIAEFAQILRGASTAESVIARLGGDEFVALISAPNDAEQVVDRIEAELVRRNKTTTSRYTLAVSTGVAGCGSDSLDSVLKRADHAMYEGKQLRKADRLASGRTSTTRAEPMNSTGR